MRKEYQNPYADPDQAALFDKLKEADKWLPTNANELAATKFDISKTYVQFIRWGKPVGGKPKWNLDVVLFLLQLAADRKQEAKKLLEMDLS